MKLAKVKPIETTNEHDRGAVLFTILVEKEK